MLGFRHVKASPSTYVIEYRNGKVVREGTGLSFFHFSPNATLVSIPLESVDVPFMFRETSSDFQEVTVQGQVAYRVVAPVTLAGLMNFTLAPGGGYASEDPTKLPQRVVNAVQVELRSLLQERTLGELLGGSNHLVEAIREALRKPASLPSLGLEMLNLSVLAIKPNPEMARALEAQVREQILKRADDATYMRRNAAIEQERAVKENELNTKITRQQPLRLVSQMADHGVIFSDGIEADFLEFNAGMVATVQVAKRYGQLVT